MYYTFFSHQNELHIWYMEKVYAATRYVACRSQHVNLHAGGAHMLWETSNIPWIIMAYPFYHIWLLRTIHETHIYMRRMYKISYNEIISHNILYLLLQLLERRFWIILCLLHRIHETFSSWKTHSHSQLVAIVEYRIQIINVSIRNITRYQLKHKTSDNYVQHRLLLYNCDLWVLPHFFVINELP